MDRRLRRLRFRYFGKFMGLLFVGCLGLSFHHSQDGKAHEKKDMNPASGTGLVAGWEAEGAQHDLKTWSVSELSRFKKVNSWERDPQTSRVVKWEGILLSQLLEKVLERLPLENRAQVDLIALKSASGEKALIPRALISKYPILLALKMNGNDAGLTQSGSDRGPIYSVIPWTSKPKILKEDLPLEKFFVPHIVRVELTNYRDQYSSLYLKRRTDPSAMRGEKLFVQNCISCHSVGKGSSLVEMINDQKAQQFVSSGHPPIKDIGNLTERDRRSVFRYFDAYRVENPIAISKVIRAVQAQQGSAPAP